MAKGTKMNIEVRNIILDLNSRFVGSHHVQFCSIFNSPRVPPLFCRSTTIRCLVIATSTGVKHELLELLLPDKMIEEEQGKLKKDRDFRVNAGGFCPRKVTELKHVSGERLCVLSDIENTGISLWQIGNSDSDLMQEIRSIPCKQPNRFPVRISISDANDGNNIVFGSCLNGLSIADLTTCKNLRDIENSSLKSEPISSLHYQDKGILITCSTCTGAINILDLRSSEFKVNKVQCRGHLASFWTMSNINSQSNDLLLLSSNGEVLLKDLRRLDENVERLQTSLSTSRHFENLVIQTGTSRDQFSISGFDGNVYIFNSKSSKGEGAVEPLFQHEGHVMNQEDQSEHLLVVKHLWHPWKQDLVMSAANDGSLHAWQYQIKSELR